MLDADAQIIPARDEGEDRGSPESDEPDKLGKGELWQRASENQRSQRYQLQRGFPFGELRNRDGDAQIRQKFPQSRHGDLPQQYDNRCNDVQPRNVARRYQHQDNRRHHDLVGNRIKRSEEHTSELQSLMRISYAVFRLKNTNKL